MTTCCKCGVRFRPRDATQKFCIRACVCPPILPRKCPTCKKPFRPKFNKTKYCSKECYTLFQRSNR